MRGTVFGKSKEVRHKLYKNELTYGGRRRRKRKGKISKVSATNRARGEDRGR